MITVMGASGNTGHRIASGLLDQGQRVRVVGRSVERLADLQQRGADVAVGDSTDPTFLADAFDGSEAVYTLQPTDQSAPDYRARQREEGEAIAFAIRRSAVPHVVALSSVGADLDAPTGVIRGLREQEERLRSVEGANMLFLRPVSFFENFFGAMESIRHEGVVVDSVEADLAIPMIAARDVAAAAVQALTMRSWTGGAVRELIGQRDLSYREATRILGERIGNPELEYVQLPYDEMVQLMVQVGLSESFARQYVKMTRSFNEGIVVPMNGRTSENTTPTSFDEFADDFAEVYLNSVAAAAG